MTQRDDRLLRALRRVGDRGSNHGTHPQGEKMMIRSRTKTLGAAAVVAAALTISAAPAGAATTDQIVRDARDGTIDGSYSRAALEATLSSPLLKVYGGQNGVEAVKSVLGAQTAGVSGSGDLPFTGAEMVTFALLGSTLLVAGFVLRRQKHPFDAP